jgi:hypothetical protein
MRNLTAALLLVISLTLVACGGGGDSGGGGGGGNNPPAQSAYDIQVVGPAATGVQMDRAFSVTLNFLEPGTANPRNVIASQTITAAVVSGPGALTGAATTQGANSSSLVFNGLILNAVGTYVLQFSGPNATAPGQTISFDVGPQRDLAFANLPTSALVGSPFSVTVQTVDPSNGQPAAAVLPINITLSLVTGSGSLGGTLTQTLSAGTSISFTGLTYNVAQQITLRASAAGFPDAISAPFTVDQVVTTFATVPANILVNGTFSLTVNLTGQVSGTSIAPNPVISATLTSATGSGSLTGNTTANSSGSTVTFTNLKYDATGNATFTASSSAAASVTTSAILFGVDVQVTATGATSGAPGAAWSPFNFRVVDGTGATWTGAVSNLAWQITNSSSTVIQSSTAVFASGIASVTPAPINTAGSYTLSGSITSPNNDSASIGLTVTSVTFINQPGPFVALKSVRVNHPYTDSVSFAAPNTTTGYALMSGSLPAGLSLNTTNGTISGTPTATGSYEFSLYAVLPGNQGQPIRCALAVFSANETEFVGGQNFANPGPHTYTGPITETYTFTSAYDNIAYPQSATFNCRIQYYYPNFATAPSPAPVLVHHRGRGFSMLDYDVLGAQIASHGFIFVTIEDYQSFLDSGGQGSTPGSGQAPNPTYDGSVSPFEFERGQASASAFQEGVMQWVIAKNTQSGHALQNHVDAENIFMSGHSRGGGATHTSHFRSQPYMFNGTQRQNINIKGTIYFMAFDMRYASSTVSGSSVMYAIPTALPRLPSLILAAENDGDLYYPICDQFIDRATGPTTFATIYGGCHGYLTDSAGFDGPQAYITRTQQQQRMFNLIIAFMKRWSNLDLTLEGLLYGNELAGSAEVGVCAWRNMAERVLVDNHQGGSATTNTLGGANTLSAGTWSVLASIYPAYGNLGSMGLRHNIMSLPASSTATYASNIPAASQNMGNTRRVMFRCGSVDDGSAAKGFDWATISLRLTDTGSDAATIVLFNPAAPSTTYLPDYTGTSNTYDRFVDVSVLLSQFTTANPNLTLTALSKVELIFTTAAGNTRQFYLDDLRFE